MQTTIQLRSEIDAGALRVFAANGFGDAAVGQPGPYALLSGMERFQSSRAHDWSWVAEGLAAKLHATAKLARRLFERFQQQRQARATYLALRSLDARMLRDLGFHRSELMSVAAEVAGNVDFTWARLSRAV